ncbi:MAG TPA: NAD(P)-binding domain-containing protein [Bryobacteraceae bacterium]|nr:NAD(P)-binding domain-containing protein [Bryobacteraceae bacterium]
MKIAIIGSGHIGGVVGKLWAQAGHQVRFSSRHPENLERLVAESGSNASRSSVDDAIAFGEIFLIAIPYGSLPDFGKQYASRLAGKIVMETGNPYPERDGAVAEQVVRSGLGTGHWSALWLPGTRLVRAFNSVWDRTLDREAHRPAPQVGIPLAADDTDAMNTVAGLVREAGFDPVLVGPLSKAREFDVGTAVYNTNMSGPEVRKKLGLPQAGTAAPRS